MAVYEEEEEGGLLAAVFAGKRMKEAVTDGGRERCRKSFALPVVKIEVKAVWLLRLCIRFLVRPVIIKQTTNNYA